MSIPQCIILEIPVNDSNMILAVYFWKFQWKIAFWECWIICLIKASPPTVKIIASMRRAMIDPQIFHPILCSMKTAPAYKSACVYEKANAVYRTHVFDYEHCWLCYFQLEYRLRQMLIKVMSWSRLMAFIGFTHNGSVAQQAEQQYTIGVL